MSTNRPQQTAENKYLETHMVVSTGNIEEKTNNWLRQQGLISAQCAGSVDPYPALTVAANPYGFFVAVPDHKDASVSPDLEAIFSIAREMGSGYVYIDRDGPYHANLPHYDW